MRGVELIDVEISGELQNVIVNGADIAPLTDAGLSGEGVPSTSCSMRSGSTGSTRSETLTALEEFA